MPGNAKEGVTLTRRNGSSERIYIAKKDTQTAKELQD
jgi:hypothetical protein